jgi:hypothetical protein
MKNLKFIVIMGLSSILFACGQTNKSKTKDNTLSDTTMTKPVENITPTEKQRERRSQSEAYCKSYDVPIYSNHNALFVDSDENVVIRTKDEIVDRALALCFIGLKSEGLEQQHLDKMAEDYKIHTKLSTEENAYVKAEKPTEQQTINANWRYESLHIMLWALSFIDTLTYPCEMCNVANDVQIIHKLTETEFREKAKLRSKKEILDQADLILRLDWACVSARIKNQDAPSNLNASVVLERHYSLNWLINYMQQDWDYIQTNT